MRLIILIMAFPILKGKVKSRGQEKGRKNSISLMMSQLTEEKLVFELYFHVLCTKEDDLLLLGNME